WRAKDRVLSLDMLTRPAEFLAGAFPCASMFSMVVDRIRTVRARATITYARLIAVTRMHAGRAINAILHVSDGDIGQVVSLLRCSGLPSRLDRNELAALCSG